jgi:hypothetical protein
MNETFEYIIWQSGLSCGKTRDIKDFGAFTGYRPL